MGKIWSTLLTVVIAVGITGSVWVAANFAFNQVRADWRRFVAIAYGALGLLLGVLLAGNRITVHSQGGFLNWAWLPALLAIICAAVGVAINICTSQRLRLAVGIGAGVGIGVLLGLLVSERYQPALVIGPLLGWTVGGGVVVAAINSFRKRSPLAGALVGGAFGAILGGWGSAQLGRGTIAESIIAMTIPALLMGARLGLSITPDAVGKAHIDRRSRAVIFLGPALLFITIALVIPTIRTFYLSLLDRRSEKFVRFDNYLDTVKAKASWDSSKWSDMFTSSLFYLGVVALAVAVVAGVIAKKRTGRAVEMGNPTVAPLVVGVLLVLFAAFTSFRGTIVNNLWWVVTVVFFSTALGLAIAVLTDGVKHEKLAKSLIFMPLAISLVGASIIWRFMYVPRDATIEQTGVLNGLWVGLGRLSTGSGLPTIIGAVLVGVVLLGLLVAFGRAIAKAAWTRAALPGIGVALVGWFFVRYTGLIGGGVGGFQIKDDGSIVPQAIGFFQEAPFNNVWLMVILIWIQAGFAMVIFSAAIKGVPTEILEAARVDGGTPSQIFWRITLPQIATTIGVVVTTLIVLVMKVFDIVKVVTNGNFGTQVLANDMYAQAFAAGNTGRGAALAIILFVSVLPVMVFNIRRMQSET